LKVVKLLICILTHPPWSPRYPYWEDVRFV